MTITLTSIDGTIVRTFVDQSSAEAFLISVHIPIINYWVTSSIVGETPSMFRLIESSGEENFYNLQLNSNVSWETCQKILSNLGLPILFV